MIAELLEEIRFGDAGAEIEGNRQNAKACSKIEEDTRSRFVPSKNTSSVTIKLSYKREEKRWGRLGGDSTKRTPKYKKRNENETQAVVSVQKRYYWAFRYDRRGNAWGQ